MRLPFTSPAKPKSFLAAEPDNLPNGCMSSITGEQAKVLLGPYYPDAQRLVSWLEEQNFNQHHARIVVLLSAQAIISEAMEGREGRELFDEPIAALASLAVSCALADRVNAMKAGGLI